MQQPPYWRVQAGELQSQIHVVCTTAQEQSLCWSDVVTLSLHLGKEKRALKICVEEWTTSLRLKLKVKCEVT